MQILGYDTNELWELVGAPCACNECREGQRGNLDRPYGQGHHQCDVVPENLLQAETQGEINAAYIHNAWRWFT